MDRREQKERLKEIIESLDLLKNDLNGIENEVIDTFKKIEEIHSILDNLGVEFDGDSLKQEVLLAFYENTNLECALTEIEDFKSEIEGYAEELSESRREKIEERYCDLDTVIELLDAERLESIDDLLTNIDECLEYLKEMKR